MSEADRGELELEHFKVLVEELPDPVYIVSERVVLFVNQAFETIIGWPREKLVGLDFSSFIAPEDLPAVADRYRRRMAGEDVPPEFEYELLLPEGGRVPVRSTSKATQMLGRAVNIGVVREIRKLRETEAALAREVKLVAAQREALARLTAPAIEVWEGVLVMPLIGSYDDLRAGQLVEDVILATSARRARELMLDLTGLSFDGPAVLHSLARIARSAGLLGTRATLVGISPRLAQEFIALELDVEAFGVYASLAEALRDRLGFG